jgi:hypothetical protein
MSTTERDPDEIRLTRHGAEVMGRMKDQDGDAQPVDVASHLVEILNISRALELAIAGCAMPTIDHDALDALAFTVTEKLETLRAKIAAEAS